MEQLDTGEAQSLNQFVDHTEDDSNNNKATLSSGSDLSNTAKTTDHHSQHHQISSETAESSQSSVTVENAMKELEAWMRQNNKASSPHWQIVRKDYNATKEKMAKLKSLLGRSAKAQREAKVELEATQKRLDAAVKEIEKLNKKIDKLSNRPTHMELLADFETNFDRALLSVGQQAGGQATAQPSASAQPAKDDPILVDTLLMQELAEYKQRIAKLESLNNAMMQRTSILENEVKERQTQQDQLKNTLSKLELEKRMALMEADHAQKALQEKTASLTEMQMEIELLTKSSMSANARAAQGEQIMKTVKTDKQHVQQLESQVQALQEWALASAEAKTLAQERVRLLEAQLRALQQQKIGDGETEVSTNERILWTKSSSRVVGAGDLVTLVVQLGSDTVAELKISQRVVLRWKFDLTATELDISFSIAKGVCDVAAIRRNQAEYLVKDRIVQGGAGGETEYAFSKDNACTLVWSNVKSWIRPRTVKYSVEVVVPSE